MANVFIVITNQQYKIGKLTFSLFIGKMVNQTFIMAFGNYRMGCNKILHVTASV